MDTHPSDRGLPCGLEIPVEVTVTMPYSEKNRAALDKYEELVKKHFWSLKTESSKIHSAISEVGLEKSILAGIKISGKNQIAKICPNEYPLIKVTIRYI